MKRFYIILVITIALVLCVGISDHRGYVLITYPHILHYESSFLATLVALFAVSLAIYLIQVLLRLIATYCGGLNPWSQNNRILRVQIAIDQGQMDLAEGRWASAESHLHRAAKVSRQPLIYYLGAARAANEQGRYEEADGFLERALERQPQSELAVAFTLAQLQIDRDDTDSALITLRDMYERHPEHVPVLRQLQLLHQKRGDWSSVINLLPELRKNKVLHDPEMAELELRAWGKKLVLTDQCEERSEVGLQSLARAWERLNSAKRQEPQLVLAYVEQLLRLGSDAKARDALHAAINRGYESQLIRLYGLLRFADPDRQLKLAEGWLKEHTGDANLLLTLGRLCLRNSLWGKARDYLESSLQAQRNPEACAELARLLAQLGDTERSNQLFEESLVLLDIRLLSSPLPVITSA